MERWTGRVALVTGASAGIGAALVKELVKYGIKVGACARNLDRLKELKESVSDQPGEVFPIRCDVRLEEEVNAMFSVMRKTYGRLDILVNNAGMGKHGTLLDAETQNWREMWEVNVLGACMCTKEGFKLMEEGGAKDCHIINIGSMSGHRLVNPDGNFYGMTKFALSAHTEGVRRELREKGSDFKISQISPGMVDTEFHVRKLGKDVGDPSKSLQSRGKILSSEDIVDACIYVLSSPPHVQVHDVMIRPTNQVV